MSRYDLHYNYDGVLVRGVIVGMMNVLHERVSWRMQIGRSVEEYRTVRVPFYFSTTGQERYLQDNFLNDVVTDPAGDKAETAYNTVPRGIVNLSGISILAAEVSHKYVRVNYRVMQDDGTMTTVNAETYWIPLELSFDCTVWVDNMLDQLKCTEAAMRAFYKNTPFEVDHLSVRVPALVSFPEQYDTERTFEYGFDDQKSYKVTFPLAVRVNLPAPAADTEFFAGNRIERFDTRQFLVRRDGLTGPSSIVGPWDPVVGRRAPYPQSVTGPSGDTRRETTWPFGPGGELPPGGGTGY